MRAIHRLLLFNSFDAGGGFVRYIPQPMNLIKGIFNTSLGRKYIMAITGAGLFGFIIAHLLGNLLVFAGRRRSMSMPRSCMISDRCCGWHGWDYWRWPGCIFGPR